MDAGHCPRCGTPYTTSEVVGFGILRARVARAGGPRLEYACQGCGRTIQLIPHGEGRYAPPGEPPPPPVPEAERRPPWLQGEPPAAPGQAAPERQPAAPAPPEAPSRASSRARREAPDPPTESVEIPAAGECMSAAEALALLRLPPAASGEAVERAFRERSLTCHPDKVAHLDAEFQELAERKFKRLRRAYDLLRSSPT